VKMHTLLDLRNNIPGFIHISDGKVHDVHALDLLLPEAGAICVLDRGYIDFARLRPASGRRLFRHAGKSNLDAHRVYSAPTDRAVGIIADQTIALDGFPPVRTTQFICAEFGSRMPNRVKGSFS
jgi:hypothetical protein